MNSVNIYKPAAFLRDPESQLSLRYFEATQFNNTGELLIFDALGAVELKTVAAHLPTLRGTWGAQTDTVLNRMPLNMKFMIDQMKIVSYRGLDINDSVMTIRAYRASPMGRLQQSRIPIELGSFPADPHNYILEFGGLNLLVDPYFALSFETTLEGNFGVSFGIKFIENMEEMTLLK